MSTLIFLTLLAAAWARPEASLHQYGLIQSQPADRGLLSGVPGDSIHVQQQLPQNKQFVPNFAPISYSQLSTQSSAIQQINQNQPALQNALNLESIEAAHHQDSYRTAHLLSSLQYEHSAGYPYASQQTAVHKHIYVHAPPQGFEEEDSIQLRLQQPAAPKQKHYKIVFIKAPSPPAIHAPAALVAPQNEEKTIIYVLHKKPDSSEDVIIPAPEPTKPSKPEVYFIKYKTKKQETPVYGPPPPAPLLIENLQEGQRNVAVAGAEYAGVSVKSAIASASSASASAAAASVAAAASAGVATGAEEYQTAINAGLLGTKENEIGHNYVNQLPSESYGLPAAAPAIETEVPESSLSAASGQLLGNKRIVVPEDQRLPPPPTAYGAPTHSYLKKKK